MVISYDDIFNPVKGKEQQLIELFVRLYGEQNREKITDRINNTEFIFIDKNPKETIDNFYTQKMEDVKNAFYKEVGLSASLNLLAFGNIKWILEKKIYDEEEIWLPAFLERIGFEGEAKDVFEQEDNYNLVLNKLNQCIEVWNSKYENKYDELWEERDRYITPFKQEEFRDNQFLAQYYENVNAYITQHMNTSNLSNEDVDFLVYVIENIIKIGKERLNDEFIVGKQLKELFIEAFKLMGYDYGEDYERYISDQNLLNCIFDNNLIQYIQLQSQQVRKNRIYNKSMFIDALKRIEQLDIKGGNLDIILPIYVYATGTAGNRVASCISYVNSKDEIRNICVLPLGINLSTETFIHELGHAVTSDVRYVDNDTLIWKTGDDVMTKRFSYKNFDVETFVKERKFVNVNDSKEENDYNNKRKNELSSEVVHDFVMNDVAEKAKAEGLTIGLKDEVETTTYSMAFPMVRDFIRENYKLVCDSQINKDPYYFAKRIGIDNYEKLSKAIHNCVKYGDLYTNELNNEYLRTSSQIKDMTMFEIAHFEYDWSPRTRKFLDTYLDAEEVFDNYYQSQQVSQ